MSGFVAKEVHGPSAGGSATLREVSQTRLQIELNPRGKYNERTGPYGTAHGRTHGGPALAQPNDSAQSDKCNLQELYSGKCTA